MNMLTILQHSLLLVIIARANVDVATRMVLMDKPIEIRPERIRLFYGYSKLKDWNGFREIWVTWFRYDIRPTPVAPYKKLIRDYSRLDADTRRLMEVYVDEHMTQQETKELTRYLQQKHKWKLTRHEEDLPAKFIFDPDAGRRTTPHKYVIDYPPGTEGIFYKLSEEEGYDLPYAVWGYYNAAAGKKEGKVMP